MVSMSGGRAVVLVVEDDEFLRGQMKMVLTGEFEVCEAETRGAAIVQVWALAPDAVVVDLHLPPDIDTAGEGIALLEWIAEHRPSLPVVAISADVGALSGLEAISCRISGVLAKPFPAGRFLALVQAAARGGPSVPVRDR
jgi:two-component system OmpR family response regulator